MSTKILSELSLQSLRSLAASLREGTLSGGLSRQPLKQIAGPRVDELHLCLSSFSDAGMTTAQMSLMVCAITEARESVSNPTDLINVVLSGPEVPGIPTADTASEVRKLIDSAIQEILIVGYAVYQGKLIFQRLAERMDESPKLKVTLCLDIPRKQTDTSLAQEIVRRFARDFREKQWPGTRLPDLFYDPRSLCEARDKRSSLHAKCVAVDRRIALVTSANFTEAAQKRNIEVGVALKEPRTVERLVEYFDALIASKQLALCVLD